ncbi:MAG: hypothetical protein H0U52_13755 [Chloroflexi bacterium]|nr:hypothetical protein [Chloroflexota bacterium]
MSAGAIDGTARASRNGFSLARLWAGRNKYLLGAICVALSTIILLPLVLSILASLKSTSEAAAVPPIYFPTHISTVSYERLWTYQIGLPTYLRISAETDQPFRSNPISRFGVFDHPLREAAER